MTTLTLVFGFSGGCSGFDADEGSSGSVCEEYYDGAQIWIASCGDNPFDYDDPFANCQEIGFCDATIEVTHKELGTYSLVDEAGHPGCLSHTLPQSGVYHLTIDAPGFEPYARDVCVLEYDSPCGHLYEYFCDEGLPPPDTAYGKQPFLVVNLTAKEGVTVEGE